MEVSADFLEKVANYVEATMPKIAKQAELDQKVTEAAPDVVDTLIKRGFIDASKRELALKAVHDPLKVLESLRKTANAAAMDRSKDIAPPSMGSAASGVKEAGVKVDNTGESKELQEANRRFISVMLGR